MADKKEKMNFKVKDRIVLLHSLPKEGDIITIRVVKDLRHDVGLNDEEVERFNSLPKDQQSDMDKIDGFDKEIEMGKVRKGIIKQSLQDLEKNKKLREEHLSLWDMFC